MNINNSTNLSLNTKIKRKILSVIVSLCFAINCLGLTPGYLYASDQYLSTLPTPGHYVDISSQFLPASLKGLHIYPDNPFQFDFFLEEGESHFDQEELTNESQKLVKYFLASLTVPEKDMWVNLSPYEKDRIIPDKFSWTEMGRDLLAQDYVLKELTSSLMHPEEELGSEFWDEVYEKVYDQYGKIDLPLDTFNKVWIVPEKAVVYENSETNSVFILESKLKVMMEEDYVAMRKAGGQMQEAKSNPDQDMVENDEVSGLTSDVVREIIIPVLEKQVNEGKHFAKLRQIYNAMVLATWFKRNLKENLISRIYADQNKVEGIDLADKGIKEKIYAYYLEAFKTGVFNYVKDEYDPVSQNIIPRKYFSGGVQFSLDDHALTVVTDKKRSQSLLKTAFLTITIGLLSSNAVQGAIDTDSLDPLPIIEDQQSRVFDEALQSLEVNGKRVDLNSLYDEIRKLENIPQVETAPATTSRGLTTSPEQLASPLKSVLQEAMKIDATNREVYQKALALMDENLRVRKDMPLGDLGYLLRSLDVEENTEASKVLNAYEGLSRIYQYNQFDPSRPTVLLMHGAGRGNFNSFGNSIERLKNKANIIYYQYNYLDPLDINTERFYSEFKSFTDANELTQPLLVLAYSNGGTTFRNAVLNYEDGLWANTHLVRIAEPLAGTGKSLLSATFPGAKLGTKIFAGRYRDLAFAHLPNSDVQKYLSNPENDLRFRNTLGSITTVTAKGDPNVIPFEKSSINPFLSSVLDRARVAYGTSYGFKKMSPQEFESMPMEEAVKSYIEVDTQSDNPHSVVSEHPETVGVITWVFDHLDTLSSEGFQAGYKSLFEEDALQDDNAMSVDIGNIGINQKFEKFPALNSYGNQKEFLNLISEARDRNDPLNVLFVCKGNIYRSRLMHLLFKQTIQDLGISNVNVSSAGTYAWNYPQSRLFEGDVVQMLLKNVGYRTVSEMHGTLDEVLLFALMKGDVQSLDAETPQRSDVNISAETVMSFVKEMNDEDDIVPLLEALSFEHENVKQQYVEILKRWQEGIRSFYRQLENVPMYRTKGDEVDSVAKNMGVSVENLSEFKANVLTKEMVKDATVIITTDENNLDLIKKGFYGANEKTFLFNRLAPDAFKQKDHVPDPAEKEISVKNLASRLRKSLSEEIIPNMVFAFAQDREDLTMNDVLLDLQNAGFSTIRDVVKKTIAAHQYIHQGEDFRAFFVPRAEEYVLLESRHNKYLPMWGYANFTPSRLHQRNVALPLIEIGTYKIERSLKGTMNGVDWRDRNRRSEEIDAQYVQSLEQVSTQMTQAAYDEFAENLKIIYEEGYRFDSVNPNNLLLDGDHFNIVDIERNHMKEKPSLKMMVAPLIDVNYIEKLRSRGDNDVLFNAQARQLRRNVLLKSIKAAFKYDLDIPETDDRIMTLAFKQAGMNGKWPEYHQRMVQAVETRKQKQESDDFSQTSENTDNFVPRSIFRSQAEYDFVKKLINKATRDTSDVPLNYYMQAAMNDEAADARVLKTIDISLNDIIKGVFPPLHVEKPVLHEDLDDIGEFDVIMAEHDIFLVSTSHNGQNAKVARLAFANEDKRAVALISFMAPNYNVVLDTYNALSVINAAGFGPLVHGMHYETDEDGEMEGVGVVTDIATGDFIDKTGDRITKETYHQFRTLHRILKDWGYVYGSDFQYFVTQSGNIEVIDPVCIFESRDQYYKHLSQLLLSMREELAVEIISEMIENEPQEFEALRSYIDEAVERNEVMTIGSWPEIAVLLNRVDSSLKNKGGIDLNAENLSIESRGGKIQMNLPDAFIDQNLMNIPGFMPVIIDIVPTTNMPLLLGLNQGSPTDATLYSSIK